MSQWERWVLRLVVVLCAAALVTELTFLGVF